MADRPTFSLTTVVLGTPEPRALAEFYQQLLGWPFGAEEDDWVTLRQPDANFSLAFQLEDAHTPPVWPAGRDEQQMQAHLDIEVDDLDAAVAFASERGATLAEHQPQDDVRVLLDPAGHPFCIWVSE
jgi:catechol 2,3-dioxygenase-like lactoylglutathione lyase family enzyme